MSINWLSSEETEITINPEDLPNFKLAKDVDPTEEIKNVGDHTANVNTKEIAKNFIVDLQNALRQKRVDDLFFLCDHKFNRLSEQHFKNALWPTVQEIE